MKHCLNCRLDTAGNHAWDCPSNPLNINPLTFTVHGCPQGCVDQVTDLKAEVSRLTDRLEETKRNLSEVTWDKADALDSLELVIDELLCGNRLYAQLTDRQNDTAALLDSAQGTINRLREELATANHRLEVDRNLDLKYLAAEQARQDAVRELREYLEVDPPHMIFELRKQLDTSEQAREAAVTELGEYKKDIWTVGYTKLAESELKSRLTKAEEALRVERERKDTYRKSLRIACLNMRHSRDCSNNGECVCGLDGIEITEAIDLLNREEAALQPEGEK